MGKTLEYLNKTFCSLLWWNFRQKKIFLNCWIFSIQRAKKKTIFDRNSKDYINSVNIHLIQIWFGMLFHSWNYYLNLLSFKPSDTAKPQRRASVKLCTFFSPLWSYDRGYPEPSCKKACCKTSDSRWIWNARGLSVGGYRSARRKTCIGSKLATTTVTRTTPRRTRNSAVLFKA